MLMALMLSAAVTSTGVAAESTVASSATAAVATSTGSCADGGRVTWNTKVAWGSTYRTSDGIPRVQVNAASWTTARAGTVPTDSLVTTYDPAGRQLQALARTSRFAYGSGSVFDARNPLDPPSAPGRTRITIGTGVDGDGYGSCTSTFLQPNLASVQAGPVSKVLTVLEENHSVAQMKAGMPYLYSLARRYGYADNYSAIRHPSLPNYLAIAAGDTFGVTDDAEPAAHPINSKTVFGQALDNGRTAGTYAESMPSRCALTGNVPKGYAVKHNPWAYFTNERALCDRHDVPETGFLTAAADNGLPAVGMLIPNTCSDAHDCGLSTADAWLRTRLPTVLASSDFTSGKLAVVITADEDDSRSDNKVLTVVLHASLDGTHRVVTTPLTHYSLSRLYSRAVGAAPLGKAATAPDMATAFGLSVGPATPPR
jgi:hypothetical protein